jgi:hypothetical protein
MARENTMAKDRQRLPRKRLRQNVLKPMSPFQRRIAFIKDDAFLDLTLKEMRLYLVL